MRVRLGRTSFRVVRGGALLLVLLLPALGAHGQGRVQGFADCEKCHKPALNKWRRDEPAQYGPTAHFNTDKQLREPKAAGYAKAIGLDDPLKVGGRCVQCHATVVREIARTGVSCESCHGAASGWLQVHDKEPLAESYQKSLPLGLRNLHKNPAAIASLCVSCHVTADKALVQAGHPSGVDFDAGAGLKKLVHWTAAFTPDNSEHAAYDYAQLTGIARPVVQKALGGAGATRPPTPLASQAPKSTGPTPQPRAGGASSLSLFAESVAVRQCPPDCPTGDSEPLNPTLTERPTPTRVQRSIVVDTATLPAPMLQAAPPTPAMTPVTTSSVKSRAANVEAAALRGQAVVLAARLLAVGRRAPSLPAPAAATEFSGPDGELLNLQDLALGLALETLRKP
jgi:Cytochrome c554 and c-prime